MWRATKQGSRSVATSHEIAISHSRKSFRSEDERDTHPTGLGWRCGWHIGCGSTRLETKLWPVRSFVVHVAHASPLPRYVYQNRSSYILSLSLSLSQRTISLFLWTKPQNKHRLSKKPHANNRNIISDLQNRCRHKHRRSNPKKTRARNASANAVQNPPPTTKRREKKKKL